MLRVGLVALMILTLLEVGIIDEVAWTPSGEAVFLKGWMLAYNHAVAGAHALACGILAVTIWRSDDEALLLDTQGFVAEGSGEHFFLVQDGAIHTPTLTSALAGITRSTVIDLAREEGIGIVERPITRDEVYVADEAFFTGTAAEVTPIRELDGRVIGNGSRGPVTGVKGTQHWSFG